MPSRKIEPVLKALQVANVAAAIEELQEPEKSVYCDVLHDPGAGQRKLDVIFIHGLKVRLNRLPIVIVFKNILEPL